MDFIFTKSIISFFNKWNGLNIFITVLCLINFSIIVYRLIKNQNPIKNIFKIENIKQIIKILAILTILIIFFIFPSFFKYAFLLTFFYYFYCIYIVPIFNIKDNNHITDIPEHFLIIISGFYYYCSILFSFTANSNITSLNNYSVQIIYVISLLILSFTFTYCILLNIYYILKLVVTHLINKVTNINIKKEIGDSSLLSFKNEKNIALKFGKIFLYYISYIILFFVGLFIMILIFPYYMVRSIKDISLDKILSIIAKLSIIFSLIIIYIIMKIDGTYSNILISIYETLISVIIIPLALEGLLTIKQKSR